jgi:hypothetical protein
VEEEYCAGDMFVNKLESRIQESGGCVVAKNEDFSPQNGDENGSRRQKVKYPGSK